MTDSIADLGPIPEHECPGDDTCEYPPGLIAKAIDRPDRIEMDMLVHLMDASDVALALIRVFDQFAEGTAPKGMPLPLVYARAREYLVKAIESAPPSPDASASLDDLLRMLMKEVGDE